MDYYTDGIHLISVISKDKNGYLVKDSRHDIKVMKDLQGYRRISDTRTIKDWYLDTKAYAKKHPFMAFLSALGVFFGLTRF